MAYYLSMSWAINQLAAWFSRRHKLIRERRRIDMAYELLHDRDLKLSMVQAQILSYMLQRQTAVSIGRLISRLHMTQSELNNAMLGLLLDQLVFVQETAGSERLYRAYSLNRSSYVQR